MTTCYRWSCNTIFDWRDSILEIRFDKLPFDFRELFSNLDFDLIDGLDELADILDIPGSDFIAD